MYLGRSAVFAPQAFHFELDDTCSLLVSTEESIPELAYFLRLVIKRIHDCTKRETTPPYFSFA